MIPPFRPVQAVLFDLDGTLIATRRLYLEAYRRALEPWYGRLLTDQEIIDLDPHSELRLLGRVVPPAEIERCHAQFSAHYRALHGTLFEGVYDGVIDLLDALRERALPLGIVTGKSRSGWDASSELLPWLVGRFAIVVVDDDVGAPKPDPGGLHIALTALRVDPASVVYVGDSISDLGAAVAAGVRPVAALWSSVSPARRSRVTEAAQALGAPVLDTPADLLRLL